ncbi:MAG: hypothetical protein KF861_23920, partial [Planctomycetaceae bacterium]|nr:hypothetical protein [Planctomycetaceae bacterium]
MCSISARRWSFLLAMMAAVSCSIGHRVGRPANAAERLQAGAYAMDITPTWFPVSSNGSMTDREVIGAHDALHARCLVLDNGRTQL